MMKPDAAKKMTADEFLVWNEERPDGRYELLNGVPVKMQAERARHAATKLNAALALRAAVRAAGLPCQTFPDGMTVVAGDGACVEPDAVVHCGDPVDGDSLVVSRPVIVVEVLSPSTRSEDFGSKLTAYLSVPSIEHVLLIDPKPQRIIVHSRRSPTEWLTKIAAPGDHLCLDPPGLALAIADFFAES